ncbi:UvrD-helicase domain-containing protein [Alloalcanivorax gelatiniphagus]|uniref:DNA 3'-5' helicase II n=1 Tax=Alloalcanivorax gelatiniphagus TaxID=1194167 RepID=A0ABY2XJ26_9GAMM|nr:UvrD-helicase domain-containing protein [Alloalcanivorax gelatiniphagus]TMW11041.1 ATP-dependent helicase [Alloalcanivorax gelatiniphagus]
MSLTTLKPEYQAQEKEIQNTIYQHIDRWDDIVFSAGAGAGKTYALVESLKHIVKHHGRRLSEHNQKVICITYTNAATAEIKERLGDSQLIFVSTIHERLWELIKNHQKPLVAIHKGNLAKKIAEMEHDISTNADPKVEPKFRVYRALSQERRAEFEDIISDKLDIYYRLYDSPANKLRDGLTDVGEQFPDILKNVGNFKKIVDTILRLKKYKACIEKIDSDLDGYTEVRYESRFNRDILHRMIISHDTLLEYGQELVSQYDILKKIIIDSFPYILIDEFQDTNTAVVTIMRQLSAYSSKFGHNFLVGYFGDEMQSIYDDGIGHNLPTIHAGLVSVNKFLNRRSHQEVIDTINKIRDDNTDQKSIYSDCTGGSVEFYAYKKDGRAQIDNSEAVLNFANRYVNLWNISQENKLHCLVLTNKLVATLSKFENVHSGFTGTKYYKRFWDRTNTEVLSTDLTKLGTIPRLFFEIMNFQSKISNPRTPLESIIDRTILENASFDELSTCIKKCQELAGESIGGFVESIFNEYDGSQSSIFSQKVDHMFNGSFKSYDNFYKHVFDELFPNIDTEDESVLESVNKHVSDLLSITLEEFGRWYRFIADQQDSEIEFHTYHGVKGLEYENVIVIMENDFGRNRDKFSSFFMHVGNDTVPEEDKGRAEFMNTKNLLYVSCSRAIRNLRVLYLDDITKFDKGIKSIFHEIHCYPDC